MTTKKKPEIKQPGSLTWPFRLGDEVKDSISGLTGVAIARIFHSTGCDRFTIEPPANDGKIGELASFDGNRLELVTAHPERHREDEVPADLHIQLGDQCKSLLSGIAGTCLHIHVPLFGAVQVDISPPWDPKTKAMPDGYFVDAAFVEVTVPYTPRPKAAQTPKPSEKDRGASPLPRNFDPR